MKLTDIYNRLHLPYFLLLLSLALVSGASVCAQELNCKVTINTEQVEGSNKEIYNTLQQSITEFINQTKWTPMTFTTREKIDCSLMLIVQSSADNVHTCQAIIQSKRPVYGTSYSTTVINHKDNDFTFTYQEFDRLEFQNANQLVSNLTALLAYYCYMIIAFDCDTYEKLGGTPYFQVCEDITSSAQSASFSGSELSGWKAFESNKNRYALINNLMDDAFRKYREYLYTYHRLGLDEMYNNTANGRARIAADISCLRDTYKSRSATYAIGTFLDAKADELTDIFAKGTAAEKKEVYAVLMDIDPTRESTYAKIQK